MQAKLQASLVALALPLAATTALAEQTEIEEVVVTAEKREATV